ncbi:hypothetical protein CASFOL_026633 [Castilleja foliolosa]|uniref:Fructokinase n=1 Tax=Castilleja foliolosa TaxID=1961234 RepID=A0ABD3CKD0_9LAMI
MLSALTGESLPVTKRAGDGVYSGSTVKQGEIGGAVIARGVHNLFGKAAHLVDFQKSDFNNLSLKVNGGSAKKSPLVVCFGEMLIDFVPTISGVSLAEAPAFKKAPGGAPANVAVCISKLGGPAAFIGKNEFGQTLADLLKENKVDNSGVRFDPSARTALAFVTLRADDEHEFMFYRHPSADMLLEKSDLDVNLIAKV